MHIPMYIDTYVCFSFKYLCVAYTKFHQHSIEFLAIAYYPHWIALVVGVRVYIYIQNKQT